ncbi:tRNA uracil 4-sulfurtransferase ThiI [Thorsellia anophelis]|uniref:tRNA sulfurtransferase n=1 Tax=Thorsellia anophelis DSM 18579 TaxID=1123402 RepID=A0A1H9Y6N6_9GAMM|nr:tRNA uracil 4-sulfurtransferase ThiI [Thorsellia anophelis]SES64546.1 [ThiS-adenylate] sulfurtransferase [Thorsellia anophelis DSM 18579]
MKYIIKLFPEIVMKSDSVRKRFSKILTSNIRNVLGTLANNIAVVRSWDHIEIRTKNHAPILSSVDEQSVLEQLQRIPGIHHILQVEEYTYTDLHNIFEIALSVYQSQLEGKSFCVRVKRKGEHNFSSSEAERYIGGGLNQSVETARVKLKHPDVTVQLEIENDILRLVKARFEGLGGFPIGTQDEVLSLISGGFDSSVASYKLIRRGCKVHYCFFNLGGAAHEIGVKQTAYYLWSQFASSHRVRFISVDFSEVVEEILTKIDNGLMGVVLKRMMVRAASQLTERYDVSALITGEAIGQVSSQTLKNLRVIDNATDTLVIRPLIAEDKETIIALARQIGTEDLAKTMPEYCGVISNSPTVCADKSHVELEEAKFDFNLLDAAVKHSVNVDIRTLASEAEKEVVHVEGTITFAENDILLDIRAPEEREQKPLNLEGIEIKLMPFYTLNREFKTLDQSKTYLLYCQKGVMSRLQALYLHELGFQNVKVYFGEKS